MIASIKNHPAYKDQLGKNETERYQTSKKLKILKTQVTLKEHLFCKSVCFPLMLHETQTANAEATNQRTRRITILPPIREHEVEETISGF